MKTAFNLKEGTRVYVSLSLEDAGKLGQLLKYAIRQANIGNEEIPATLGQILRLDEALQVYSRCLEPDSGRIETVESALNGGDKCKDCGQDWKSHKPGMTGGIDCQS